MDTRVDKRVDVDMATVHEDILALRGQVDLLNAKLDALLSANVPRGTAVLFKAPEEPLPRVEEPPITPRCAEATSGPLEALAVEAVPEPFTVTPVDLPDAVESGWRLMLFRQGVTTHEQAVAPLGDEEAQCLAELLMSAKALVVDGGEAMAFATLMVWVELFARDATVTRGQKTAKELLVRMPSYVTGNVPEDPARRWTPERAVEQWKGMVGP